MLSVLSFIFTCITDFMKMLFHINIGNSLNLGLLMCICFVFLPMMARIVNFFKMYANDVTADALMSQPTNLKGGKKK